MTLHATVAAALALTLIAAPAAAAEAPAATPGAVVAFGGGKTPIAGLREMLKLARGADSRVVVIPHATKSKRRGTIDLREWRQAGAKHIVVLDPLVKGEAAKAVLKADIIWFGGGNQRHLMEALRGAAVVWAIRKAHSRGAVVGGTSAGAAVLSKVMISGAPAPGPLRKGSAGRWRGLGVASDVIVDQHFMARKRQGRLLTAVLDHPQLVGVGVGEDTCAVLHQGAVRVVGKRQVMIFDARQAEVAEVGKRARQSATGVRVHVLEPGATWRLSDPAAQAQAPTAPERATPPSAP